VKTVYRVAAFFLIVCFLPFFRSCGDVSMGFPAAALAGDWVLSIDKVNWLSLVINLCVMMLLSVTGVMVFKKRPPGKIVSAGIKGVIIYHVLILAGYFVTYPLYMVFHNWFMEYAVGIHLYALYPLHEVFEFQSLDRISETSVIYGDMYDIRLRLHYLLMIFFWFGSGCFAGYLRSRRSAAE